MNCGEEFIARLGVPETFRNRDRVRFPGFRNNSPALSAGSLDNDLEIMAEILGRRGDET